MRDQVSISPSAAWLLRGRSDSVPSADTGHHQYYESQPPLSMAKVIMSRHVSALPIP